ncbi:MAG: DUF2125 domain-containing protein [Alphaproteobacteria bacterium]
MRLRYYLLLGVLGLGIAGYVGYWFFAADQVRGGIDAWAAEHRARGLEIAYGEPQISGFPWRLIVEIDDPSIAMPLHPAQPRWSAPRIAAVAQPWNFRQVLIDLAGAHDIGFTQRGTRREMSLAVPEGRAGYVADPAGQMQRLSIDLTQPTLEEPATGLKAQAARVQLHLRPGQSPDVNLELASSAEQLSAQGLGPMPFGQVIDKLALESKLRGVIDGPSPDAALAAWRDAGGTVDIDRLLLLWGDLQLETSGTLALDEALRPLGALTARMTGQNAVIDLAVAKGQMSTGAGSAAKAALGVLAAAGGGVLSVPVRMQDGALFIGPAKVARLSPVFPDAGRNR